MSKLTTVISIIIFGLLSTNSIAEEVHNTQLNSNDIQAELALNIEKEMDKIMRSLLEEQHAAILIAHTEDKVLLTKREDKITTKTESTAEE
ncbi:hypothetical protein D5R81_12595 [Parashewanella spongiae]|uniref:Uncharacterized protein n=1 Tax=Parashewanella spongiae TaxID=342950 RepID=A0A3A6U3T8_9GAMM|nr:hypothetical protein [Parashewanella spongiae]MCL1078788.1 hypothetical protein [Parashewanella spongiae]RJY12210.1 hypothetical protein D5R81_12595 [Parashewanella spongiae]